MPCDEVPGCGSVGSDVKGTGIMSVPGKVATEVGGWGGALSIWRMSSVQIIGSLVHCLWQQTFALWKVFFPLLMTVGWSVCNHLCGTVC